MLITDLKKELSLRMNIPVESQKLVFKGKTMLDASKVGEHTLEEGESSAIIDNDSLCIVEGLRPHVRPERIDRRPRRRISRRRKISFPFPESEKTDCE